MEHNNQQIISECPVCHSRNIIQKIVSHPLFDMEKWMIYGAGSHCGNCGIKFAFNSDHLEKELKDERERTKKAIAKGKARARKEMGAKKATK